MFTVSFGIFTVSFGTFTRWHYWTKRTYRWRRSFTWGDFIPVVITIRFGLYYTNILLLHYRIFITISMDICLQDQRRQIWRTWIGLLVASYNFDVLYVIRKTGITINKHSINTSSLQLRNSRLHFKRYRNLLSNL